MTALQLQWSSWAEFLAMGGYGLYVWGSFGVTAGVLLAEVVTLWRRRRALLGQMRARRQVPGEQDD